MVPLPLPDGVTVHQFLLLLAFHDVFEVTVNVVDPAGLAGTFWFEGLTLRVGDPAAWVTFTVTVLAPPAATVMVATLAAVVVFAA